ncbi:MAG: ANTAR domain-containing response regulator [Arenicellales bacterium]
MDLILVTDSIEGLNPLIKAASTAGWRVRKHIGPNDQASLSVKEVHPDAVVFVTDEVDRQTLKEMKAITEDSPVPIVLMTRDNSQDSIDAAVKAGCTAYVVDCADHERIGSLLQVAKAKFSETQRLSTELEKTRNELADRKSTDRAKGIIMQARGLSEDEAYKALRKLAMDKNKRIGEIAEQVIAAAEILV